MSVPSGNSKRPKFIICKISSDLTTVVVEQLSNEEDYETFLTYLSSAIDENGHPAPRYAVYDVEYSLGAEGERTKTIFISWVPNNTSIKVCLHFHVSIDIMTLHCQLRMIYASTREQVRKAFNVGNSIHADDLADIEWDNILAKVKGGI
ncbi:cofilin, actophorin [Trichoderma evansii]